MKLLLSVAAQDRHFAKNIRRVRPQFDSLFENFSAVEMVNPIHEAILIGLTDAKPENYFAVIPNKDDFFQVLAGLKSNATDGELKAAIFSVISKSISACPFSQPDREKFVDLLSNWGVP